MTQYYTCKYQSPCGELTILSNSNSILELRFEGEPCSHNGIEFEPGSIAPLNKAVEWLDCYFSGKTSDLPVLSLAPEGTPFQRHCWEKLRNIPYGKTVTYKQIANEVATDRGMVKMSAQAVGQAVGRNPIPIIIPCHRVIGSNGDLTGYSAGLTIKKILLKHERII